MNFEEFKAQYQKVPVEEYFNQVPDKPMVSVCVQTYQHAPYIRECLEGILMQVTDFPYEILLGEDESTDGTREICIEYAQKYPDRIRLFLHHRKNNINILGSPSGRFNSMNNFYSSRGKYIAMCEGDDYWTDSNKLQYQFDYLESHVDYSLHLHSVKYYQEGINNFISTQSFKPLHNNEYSIKDVIFQSGRFRPTCSMFFLKDKLFPLPQWYYESAVGDLPMCLILASRGKIYRSDQTMGVYRVQSSNSWSRKLTDSNKYFKQNYFAVLQIFDRFNQWSDYKYRSDISRKKIIFTFNYIRSYLIKCIKGLLGIKK